MKVFSKTGPKIVKFIESFFIASRVAIGTVFAKEAYHAKNIDEEDLKAAVKFDFSRDEKIKAKLPVKYIDQFCEIQNLENSFLPNLDC